MTDPGSIRPISGQIHITEVKGGKEAGKTALPPEKLRQEVKDIITSNDENWDKLTGEVVGKLGLEPFCNTTMGHAATRAGITVNDLQDLKQMGWAKFKKTRPPNEMQKFEAFRQEAKSLIQDKINEVFQDMNLPSIKWVAIGTPGFDSDIDLTSTVEDHSQHSEIATTMAKTLFDVIFYETFEHEFSGDLVDLETYTAHEGKVIVDKEGIPTGSYPLLATEEGKQGYMAGELFASAAQVYRSYGEGAEWDKFKAQMSMGDENIKHIFSDIEKQEKTDEANVEKLAAKLAGKEKFDDIPLDQQHKMQETAYYAYKTSRLIKIAVAMDECQVEKQKCLKNIEKALGNVTMAAQRDDMPTMQKYNAEAQVTRQQLDMLEVTWGNLGVLRELYLPEGYMSRGAYLAVCERGGGQKEARIKEEKARIIEEHGAAAGGKPGQLSNPHELIMAFIENIGKYRHSLDSHGEIIPETHIDASKYALRIVGELIELIDHAPDKADKNLKEVLEIYQGFMADLEKVKRKTTVADSFFAEITPALFEEESQLNTSLRTQGLEFATTHRDSPSSPSQLIDELYVEMGKTNNNFDRVSFDKMFTGWKESNTNNQLCDFLEGRIKEVFPESTRPEEIQNTVLRCAKAIKEIGDQALLTPTIIALGMRSALLKKGLVSGTPDRLLNPKLEALISSYAGVVDHSNTELSKVHEAAKEMTIAQFQKHELDTLIHVLTTLPNEARSDIPTDGELAQHMGFSHEQIRSMYQAGHPDVGLYSALEKLTLEVSRWAITHGVVDRPKAEAGFMTNLADKTFS